MVWSRQGRYVVEGSTVEDPHNALGTADVQVILPNGQTVGTGCLGQKDTQVDIQASNAMDPRIIILFYKAIPLQ